MLMLLPKAPVADVAGAETGWAAVCSNFRAVSPSWSCCFFARLAVIKAEPYDVDAELEISIVYLLPKHYRPGRTKHEPYRSDQVGLVR